MICGLIGSQLHVVTRCLFTLAAGGVITGAIAACGSLLDLEDDPASAAALADAMVPADAGVDAVADDHTSSADAGRDAPTVAMAKNSSFEVAPGAAIDLDEPATFTPEYIMGGGWSGLPNEPYNTVIADGYGRDGSRGARMTRETGTSGSELPGFRQTFSVTPAEQGCLYRVSVDVYAEDAAAKLRLGMAFDRADGVHAAFPIVDAVGTVGRWETLMIEQRGPTNVVYSTIEVSVGPQTVDYFGASRADNFSLERTCP